MGITIREIVEEIGGGVAEGRTFKAVQVGGPSGGCVPAELADTPVDYDALTRVGAIMGSGGLVVLDDTDCMVDIARYFLRFTQDQSCGKCTFCRIGTRRMLDILDRIAAGKGKPERPRRTGATGRGGRLGEPLRAGHARPPTRCSRRCGISARNTRPTSPAAARPTVQGPDPLPRDRPLHRLHALRPAVPGRRHPHDALRPPHHRPGKMHPLRHLPAGLPAGAVEVE